MIGMQRKLGKRVFAWRISGKYEKLINNSEYMHENQLKANKKTEIIK